MWLIVHVLSVAVLAVMAELFCKVFKPRPAIAHALWLAVLIKLVVPPLVAWPVSAPEGAVLERHAQVDQAGAMPAPVADDSGEAAAASAAPAAVVEARPPALDARRALVAAWFMGAFGALLIHMLRLAVFTTRASAAAPAPEWLQAMSDSIADTLRARRPRVLVTDAVSSAVVWNPFRPKIAVSRNLLDTLPRQKIAGVIAHELAHLRRGDLWAGLAEVAAACAWWWNPLLYVTRKRLHAYREMASDAWALWAVPLGRREYADTLVRAAASTSRRAAPLAAFGGGAAAGFEQRLTMVLRGGIDRAIPRRTVAVIAAVTLLVLPGWAQVNPAATAGDTPANEVYDVRVFFTAEDVAGFDLNRAIGLRAISTNFDAISVGGRHLERDEQGWPVVAGGTPVCELSFPVRRGESLRVVSKDDVPPGEPLEMNWTLEPEGMQLRLRYASLNRVWTQVRAERERDRWVCLWLSTGEEDNIDGHLLVFWRKREHRGPQDDQDRAEQCILERMPYEFDEGPRYRLAMTFIEIPEEMERSIAARLRPMPGSTAVSEYTRIMHVGSERRRNRLFNRLNRSDDAELISVPWITFSLSDTGPKIMMRRAPSPEEVYAQIRMAADEELFDPFAIEQGRYRVIITDILELDKPDGRGLMVAAGAVAAEQPDVLDVNLYANPSWNPPDAEERINAPFQISYSHRIGDSVAWFANSPKPGKRILAVTTLDEPARLRNFRYR